MKNITISGIIGVDVTPADLRRGLEQAAGDDVELVISSPGGFVADGIEMFNAIRNYSGRTTARLAGYCMSMASYIPLAADRIVAEDNAVLMVHNPSGGAIGDYRDMMKYGDYLANLTHMFARTYARHTGQGIDVVRGWMDATTFFFGSELTESGFAHELVGGADTTGCDRGSSCGAAMAAWEACRAAFMADAGAVAADITRAVAMMPAGQPVTESGKHNRGAKKMNVETLKRDHQDLVETIRAEAEADMRSSIDDAVAAARLEGAEAERRRIADVRAQLVPGHESVIARMELDGVSTGADAAMAIVAAEKSLRASAAAMMDAEANDTVPPVVDGGTAVMKRADFDALPPAARAAMIRAGATTIID